MFKFGFLCLSAFASAQINVSTHQSGYGNNSSTSVKSHQGGAYPIPAPIPVPAPVPVPVPVPAPYPVPVKKPFSRRRRYW